MQNEKATRGSRSSEQNNGRGFELPSKTKDKENAQAKEGEACQNCLMCSAEPAARYYFVALCQPFSEWLRREWGDPSISIDDAHDILKAKVLGWDERLIEQTGENVRRLPRTKDMDKWDFNNYIEKAAAWLAELGIVVIPSELFWEGATEGKKTQ